MSAGGLNFSRRLRRTPYTDRVEAAGVRDFSVVNHMLLPKAFATSVEEDYWHLREDVQIWDVSCQRQVEIRGVDAVRLVQWMTPRDLRSARVGECFYAPLVDVDGGMVNDPVILKLADAHFWVSIADSDVLLWARGLATGVGMSGARLDVEVDEPDVFPLAIQGARAEDLMAAVFGEGVREIGFFKFARVRFEGTEQVVARSGYSRQGGFEIYLRGGELGGALWDALWEAGRAFNLRAGCPNLIERIEGGLLSYGNDITRANHPLECGLAQFCDLLEAEAREVDGLCLGLPALRRIRARGVGRYMRGILFDGSPCPPCAKSWQVFAGDDAKNDSPIGEITSAAYSPRLRKNVGLAIVNAPFCEPGQSARVFGPTTANYDAPLSERAAQVSALPFN